MQLIIDKVEVYGMSYETYGRRSSYYKKIAGIRERQDNGTLTNDDEWFSARECERVKNGFKLKLKSYLENELK